MLKESFIVATSTPAKPSHTNKDLGIHLHEFQPLPALISSFKKSSAQPNCLAVSASHIFAAQAEKAVIHVYSRDNGNQEAVVPFPEQIYSIALGGDIDGAGVLVLGTEGGRVILWELGTGRQISTPQSHLQPTSCLVVEPTSNFLLSGSSDSNIHVWSIPSLLSFSASSGSDPDQALPFSPFRTLSSHRAAINAIEVGHSYSSTNIAVSASKDNTIVVWDYSNGVALHTYLLPSAPLCLALDPADRAVYAGYDDGSIQLIDFYKQPSLTQVLHDPAQQSTPTQPPPSDRWPSPGESAATILCLQVSYDGTTLLSGHNDGKVQTWDIAKGRYNTQLADFSAPVTNLQMLAPSGFPNVSSPPLKLQNIVKPRYQSSLSGSSSFSSSTVPINYTLTARFTSTLSFPHQQNPTSTFQTALTHPSFSPSLLEEGLTSFAPQLHPPEPKSAAPITSTDGAMDISADPNPTTSISTLQSQNAHLLSQLNSALVAQRSAIAEVLKLDKERWERKEEEAIRAAAKKRRRLRRMRMEEVRRKVEMGEKVEDGGVEEEDEEEEVSSSTDEMTESE